MHFMQNNSFLLSSHEFFTILDVNVSVQCGTNSFISSKVIHLCIFRSTMLIIKVLPVRPVIIIITGWTGKTWMQIDCVNPWNSIPKRFPFYSELQWLILVNASLQINIHWMNNQEKLSQVCDKVCLNLTCQIVLPITMKLLVLPFKYQNILVFWFSCVKNFFDLKGKSFSWPLVIDLRKPSILYLVHYLFLQLWRITTWS